MGKVFKNGNSLAVTVPTSFAHQLRISEGSEVKWEQSGRGLVLTPQDSVKAPSDIDPEVAKLIKKLSKKYSQVWEDLAKV